MKRITAANPPFYCGLLWLEGTVPARGTLLFIQTLTMIRMHLTNWDQVRGIFFCLLCYSTGKSSGLQGLADGAKDQENTIQEENNALEVFTAHINKNITPTLWTPIGKITFRIFICKVLKHNPSADT